VLTNTQTSAAENI